MKVFQDLRDDVVAFGGTPESVSQDLRMDLAELVARHLRDAGLTQTQFAEKFGKKAPYINRIIGVFPPEAQTGVRYLDGGTI